jgi:CCR4-NOT transcription complex subunit 7/8
LKLIQIGFSLCDENGKSPEKGLVWQFNFNFDLKTESYNPESIEKLINCGLDFNKFKSDGCDP